MAKETKVIKYLLGQISSSSPRISKCWVTTSGGTVFADETTDINSTGTADVPLGAAVNDAIYFGNGVIFSCISAVASTQSAGGAATWEYWNGTSWTTLTTSGYTASNWATNTNTAWSIPSDWATTQVNSEVDGPWYYVRLRVTSTRTTGGTLTSAQLAPVITAANAFSVYIGETTNRTITNCTVRTYFERTAAGSSINNYFRVRGAWDGGTLTDLKTPFTSDNSWQSWGEKATFIDDVDITTSAQSAWSSGTTHTYTLDIASCGRGLGTPADAVNRVYAEMFITYESEDTNTTKMNTVVIPVGGITGTLATSLTTIGTLPANILEESGITIRDLYISFHANWDEAGTTDWTFYGRLNSESEVDLGLNDAAQQSDFYTPIPWRRTDLNLAIENTIQARVSSNTGATASHVSAIVTITYSYDDTTTTRRTYTEEIPYTVWSGLGATVANRPFIPITWWVPGANPTFKSLGTLSIWNQNSDPGDVRITLGNATERSFTSPHADMSGPVVAMNIATSGDFNFGRGLNKITLSAYATSTPANMGAMTGLAYVTWSYDKEAGKDHYTGYSVFTSPADYIVQTIQVNNNTVMNIPDISSSNYFITNCGCHLQIINNTTIATQNVIAVLPMSGGRIEVPMRLQLTDANMGTRPLYNELNNNYVVRFYNNFNKYNTKIDPTVPFITRFETSSTVGRLSGLLIYNWHTYNWDVSGTISGSAGGTVTLRLFDNDTLEILQEITRTGNGSYTFKHFDNTRDVHVVAIENDTRKGVSKQDVAGTGGFDINLSSTGGSSSPGGFKAFVWGS